ncbi:MAG: DUF6470 family protein [Oscillospiraceae bacterium]
MEQLLSIKCIPIKLEFETQPMKIEVSNSSQASLEISREKGGLQIESMHKVDKIEISKGPHVTPIRTPDVNREPHTIDSSSSYKDISPKHKVVQNPTIHLSTHNGPNANLNELSMQYKMDQLKFEYRTSSMNRKFTPGNIEYTVSQYPDVLIDYIGDMIYAPPSSNPNYEEKIVEE